MSITNLSISECKPSVEKILFIGNSATYVNDIPHIVERFANSIGYNTKVKVITERGFELAQHADCDTSYGQKTFIEIQRGYDIVFLQEHSNCITSDKKRKQTKLACEVLNQAVCNSGGKTYIYVRPPSGKLYEGYTPLEQSIEFDKLFGDISSQLGIINAYVNRAFCYATVDTGIMLWGADLSHTNKSGAYLAACVLFSTLFLKSATILDSLDIPVSEAHYLQTVSDKVVFDGWLPSNPIL